MKIHILDPLLDCRWGELAARHPRASVFHDPGWLKALARTYGYEPFALTSAPPGEPFTNGLVACRVSSWMTGSRLVSLPFSDHCDLLVERQEEAEEFARWMKEECNRQRWKYVELRPLSIVYGKNSGLQPSGSYWLHELDLEPDLGQIYERLHRNSFQRKIERAEREGISYEAGRSEHLLREFYGLLVNTRKRQRLLPQPRVWFQNLVECLGEKLEIRVAREAGTAIAAILTLRHRTTVVYKYGCSDEQFHNLGAMPFLFWKVIEESKASGATKIDFGRTDLDNPGLLAFKDRLGTSRRQITYYRYTKNSSRSLAGLTHSRMVRRFFSILPDGASAAAGRIIYRHFG